MNHSKKTINYQQKREIKKIKTGGVDSFYNLLAQDSIQKIMKQDLPNYRDK